MALFATFIGINKYKDKNISDLSGAVRDATSMWALFSDSVSSIEASKLIDDGATKNAVENRIEEVISKADSEDTVLIYFAGHGTPNHQLVPHDCRKDDVENTSIEMSVLTNLLQSSSAKANIIILDCCFSGGATARVLQDIPKERSFSHNLNELKGKGRIIIAAANEEQSAYEINGQGVFTKELVNILIESKDSIGIGELTDKLVNRVNSITSKYGWDQTPVIFNLIEGQFSFPNLKPGSIFQAEFPETTGVNVSTDLDELKLFNINQELIKQWKEKFAGGLNELQLSAINDYRILDGKSLLTVAPTSSGKTFIGELAAAKSISEGKKAVFLLPYRALTNEKYEDFKALYQDKLKLSVIRCTGDYTDETSSFMKGKFDIALLTYEMFLNLVLGNSQIINKVGLIVVDEAQFITDQTRGINVELLLTKIISEREKGNNPQLILLSAVIGDINNFHNWLETELLYTQERPIPLVEGVLDRNGTFQYLTPDGSENKEQLVDSRRVYQRGRKKSSQDILIPLISKLVSEGERVIVFRNSRGATKGCANYLSNELGLKKVDAAIESLPDSDQSSSSKSLVRALNGGTAFHNSDLNRDERIIVEKYFREGEGISVLVATSTVAAGINTPANTVIIVENFFYGETNTDYTVAQYKNMSGRAGRLGISSKGRSILIAKSEIDRKMLFDKYVKGEPEAIESTFSDTNISTWIIRLLSQVDMPLSTPEIISLLSNTYGGYLNNLENPDWKVSIKEKVIKILNTMNQYELIKYEGNKVILTLLGIECGKSGLSFESNIKLIKLLQHFDQITSIQLIALLQTLPEVAQYTPLFRRGHKESGWQTVVSEIYGRELTLLLQRNTTDKWDYYASCKRAAILNEWIEGTGISDIEYKFTINPYSGSINAGDIRRFADITRLYLRSAFVIIDLLLLGKGPDEEEIDSLLLRLEYGIPEEALELLDLPIILSRGEMLNLYRSSVLNKADFDMLTEEEKRNCLRESSLEALE